MTTDKRRPAPQIARHGEGPGYWRNETSGVLEPAIMALLENDELTLSEIAALRAYFRQWILSPVWAGPGIDGLRLRISELESRQAIRRWLDDALRLGLDPL